MKVPPVRRTTGVGAVGQGVSGGYWWALGILLAGVKKRQYLNPVGHDAIYKDVVGVNHRFARAGDAAWTMKIGMVGQAVGGVTDGRANTIGRHRVAHFDIVDDLFESSECAGSPDDRKH